MSSLRFSATPGTCLMLMPSEGSISVSVDSSNTSSPLASDIVLTSCNGGLRLTVVPPRVSSQFCGEDAKQWEYLPVQMMTGGSPHQGFGEGTFESSADGLQSIQNSALSCDTVAGVTSWDALCDSALHSPGMLSDMTSLSTPFELEHNGTEGTISTLSSLSSEPSSPLLPTKLNIADSDSLERPRKNLTSSSLQCRFPGCSRTLKSEHTRRRHEASHKEIRCTFPDCGTRFKRNHDRMRHEYLHHGQAVNLCAGCHRTFISKENLRKHRCTHSAK